VGTRNGEHYFTASPSGPSEQRSVRLVLPDLTLELVTDRGVFSGQAVDAGTKLLLTEAPMPNEATGSVLDLGCGYGPIAVTVARRSPRVEVWALDVNERALALTAQNAERCGVAARVRPVTTADLPDDISFRAIYSNPPIRIGKAALHELLGTWLRRLSPDGAAWLVVHKHLGSDSLAKWLEGEGLNVRRLVSRMGYRLLEVRPR
jgi:16S rRNA (guanine1207-N2)-methyltransferase